MSQRDVAIVGMACLFPGSNGLERYWQNICSGAECLSDAPEKWGAERYLSAGGATRIATKRGGFLGDLYRFDPAELGVMPASVDGGEPDQFLALRIAAEALADAGLLDRDLDHDRSGIILGHSTYLHRGHGTIIQHGVVVDQTVEIVRAMFPDADEAALKLLHQTLREKLPRFNSDMAPGLVPNVMTGRIANKLDLKGPNYIIDAACAASLLSVQAAREELCSGRSDLMLAGGVNAAIPAEVYSIFTQLGALSALGRVRPFDAEGDGTLLAEGLGVIVLKRLADAEADGDRIYALIRGMGQSSDGRGSGILAPRLEGEILAIERAYEDAGLPPTSLGLLEAHGTAIPLGDKTEVAAIRSVFGPRDGPLPSAAIGSVKSMIGHCIPAAGIAGLIKCALSLYHKTLPPTICGAVRTENGLEGTPFHVNTLTTPWISLEDRPRRAGVNAFGFGGVNAHALLEEAAGPKGQAPPASWPVELIVMAAGTPTALHARAEQVIARLGAWRDTPLSVIAASLAREVTVADAEVQHCRLAIVATSTADLVAKLEKALVRLAAGRGRFQMRSGIYCADAALAGKLAFVFPGEGSQYQGMLNDLLIAFPSARRWFDFWDGIYSGTRDVRPSSYVFPPTTTLSQEAGDMLETGLFSLEVGSEAVFIASQAVAELAGYLELRPDAIVGHSSGEHSALRAAGVIGGGGTEQLRRCISELNGLYREMEAAEQTGGTGVLLTVGAVPRDRILELVATHPIDLALDNCQHQAVLFGAPSDVDAVAGILRREGGICSFLPIDRPYHTPRFAPVAEMVRAFYDTIAFEPPEVQLYSCATTEPMPTDPGEIRDLAARQWQSRVRFTETIERLYQDGVRIFVEIGPSSSLTGFVDDILKGREALALSTDSRRRSSLTQFLHTLGRLWLAGRSPRLHALYEVRAVEPVDLDAEPPRDRSQHFDNTLPFIRISEQEGREIRDRLIPAPPAPASVGPVNELVESAGFVDREASHLALRDRMREAAGAAGNSGVGALHFIHRIEERTARRLVAECDVDIDADAFLAEHVLYTSDTSDFQPGTGGLPVVPLAVSLEIISEGAVALMPDHLPIALENVRALDWVMVESGFDTLVVIAEAACPTPEGQAISVRLMRGQAPLVEAVVIMAEPTGVAALPPPLPPLTEPQVAVWQDHELYTTGMFHGPMYHSVGSILKWDSRGIDVALNDTPLDRFPAGGLVFNPILLDAIGHVTAFWIAQGYGTDFSSFPSSIARVDLYDAAREETYGCQLSARLGFDRSTGTDGAYLLGEFQCTDPDGRALFSVRGWRDRFFDVPNRFYHARFKPRESWYGADISNLFNELPVDTLVWGVPAFPKGFLSDAGGVWCKVLAHTVLAPEEREQFYALPKNNRRREDWLVGRIAMKEVSRAWIAEHTGNLLLPADIVICRDDAGRPFVSGQQLSEVPEVSVAHVEGEAVAVASYPGNPVGVDFERSGRAETSALFSGGFSADEHALVIAEDETSVLRGWCAKEAAAKMLGQGLNGRPRSFALRDIHGEGTTATVDAPRYPGIRVSLADCAGRVYAVAYP